MRFFKAIKEFFGALFSRNPQESARRKDLKRIYAYLSTVRPQVYKPGSSQVPPGLARVIFQFCGLLRPVSELARRTIASQDARVSQRFREALMDSGLNEEERRLKSSLGFEALAERVRDSLSPEAEMEKASAEFETLLKAFDREDLRAMDLMLNEMERLVEVCHYDYERILGLFDPRASLDDPAYRPDFGSAPATQVLPELIDFYYVIEGFAFTPLIEDGLSVLLERLNPTGFAEQRKSLAKVLAGLNKMLSQQLDRDLLLSLARALKGDPNYAPQIGRDRSRIVDAYRARLSAQFQRDRERVAQDLKEDAIAHELKALFGDAELPEIEGYNDETNARLRQDSTEAFLHIKPLRIIRGYLRTFYESGYREAVKRLLVEGYFDNKGFQNNLANVYYLCEKVASHIADFEASITGAGRMSIPTMKRYLEEARRGKDVSDLLNKLVASLNSRAKAIVDNDASLFNALATSVLEVTADYRRPTPEVVSNIRTLGAGKNRDLMNALVAGSNATARFVALMRHFTQIEAIAVADDTPLPYVAPPQD
jgi:hypothetical protein